MVFWLPSGSITKSTDLYDKTQTLKTKEKTSAQLVLFDFDGTLMKGDSTVSI